MKKLGGKSIDGVNLYGFNNRNLCNSKSNVNKADIEITEPTKNDINASLIAKNITPLIQAPNKPSSTKGPKLTLKQQRNTQKTGNSIIITSLGANQRPVVKKLRKHSTIKHNSIDRSHEKNAPA